MMTVLVLFVLLFFLDSFSAAIANPLISSTREVKGVWLSVIARISSCYCVIARSVGDVAIYGYDLLMRLPRFARNDNPPLPLKRDRNDRTLHFTCDENKRENTDDQDNTGHDNPVLETYPSGEPSTEITLRQIILRFRAILIVIILFLLITAVQLLPFLELKSQSIRSSGLTYFEATTWSFAWKDFIQFFLPDAFGYFKTTERYWSNQSWLKTVYLGIIPFVLSIFFFVSKDRKRWIFLLLMVISFIFALGGNTPIYHLLHKIPPFNSIRYPVKFLFLFFFIISITSGIGLDRLIEGVKNKSVLTKKIVQIVFYSGFIFAVFWGYLYLFDADVYIFLDKNGFKPSAYNDIWFNLHNAKRFLLFAFLFCVMLLVYLRIKNKKIVLYTLVFLIIIDLFLASYGFYRFMQWNQYIAKRGFEDVLSKNVETERYFVTKKTAKDFESFPLDRAVMSSAYAPLFGLYTIEGSEVMRIFYHDIFLQILNSTPSISDAKRFFDMSGVRYAITSYKVNDDDLKLVKSIDIGDKTAYLYEYTGYPGRFLLFSKVSFVKDDKTVIERLQSNTFDPGKELILVGDRKDTNEIKDLHGKVKLLSYKANRFDLEYEAASDAFLYVSDTYYPGWRAYVDGKETKIYRADLAFRAIEVPKGKHTVVFKYVPMSFYIGLVLTIMGILLCIWLWRRDKAAESKELRAGSENGSVKSER
ncbi:MAG: YfhO family protein [Syntrophorhabdaceae bacterium]|nr:YfhO family protein [Syntrophorhabdaceae bacterium]